MLDSGTIYGDSTKCGVSRYHLTMYKNLELEVTPSDDTNQKGIILVCIVTKKTYR